MLDSTLSALAFAGAASVLLSAFLAGSTFAEGAALALVSAGASFAASAVFISGADGAGLSVALADFSDEVAGAAGSDFCAGRRLRERRVVRGFLSSGVADVSVAGASVAFFSCSAA